MFRIHASIPPRRLRLASPQRKTLFAIAVLLCLPVYLRATDLLRPNIVLIISDDQTYSDFGFMGNQQVDTPNIDQLASQSARFVSGYVPSSVCRPSLVTLLTGLYPHQHGVHFNHPPPGFAKLTKSPGIDKREFDALRDQATGLIRSVPTLPRLLASSGYRCLQTGKYWEGHWRNAGFTEGMATAEPSPAARHGNKMLANGEVVAHGNGDHGLTIGRQTMQPIFDFIDDCRDAPFFVWYAPFLPHQPHDAPQEYFELYQNRRGLPEYRIPYYASITQFDDTVGERIRYVEQRNLAERTVFLLVVDNGWQPDASHRKKDTFEWEHTKRSKRAPFDYGLRTPILIRWDGQVKAATHPQLVSSVDIMPTLLSAAGVAAGEYELPGVDLLPSALGNSALDAERPVFGEVYPGDATSLGHPSRDVAYRWVRKGKLKLITTHTHGTKTAWGEYLGEDALFDVVADPDESRNLIRNPMHAKQHAELRRLLDHWWTPDEN